MLYSLEIIRIKIWKPKQKNKSSFDKFNNKALCVIIDISYSIRLIGAEISRSEKHEEN